jgi:hypothetical protein
MTDYTNQFGDAAKAIEAFKITAQAVIKQGEKAVSDGAGDTSYNSLSDVSKAVPFSAAATSYADMLEVVPSPLAERIAVLAVNHSKSYKTAGEQVVNQLYLADISEKVPGFGDELQSTSELRSEVTGFLRHLQPSQVATLHEEAEVLIKDLSVQGQWILADNIYAAISQYTTLKTPSPNLADRLYGVLITNPIAEMHDRYIDASTALFDRGTMPTQRDILNARIQAASITPEEDYIANDPILSRFGKTMADFQCEDGQLKTADFFIFNPSGKGQTRPLDLGSSEPK